MAGRGRWPDAGPESEGDGSLIIFGRPSPRRCLFANSVQSISFSFKSNQSPPINLWSNNDHGARACLALQSKEPSPDHPIFIFLPWKVISGTVPRFYNQGKYPLRPTPPLRPHRVLQVTAIPATRQESRGLFFTQKVPSLLCYFYVLIST